MDSIKKKRKKKEILNMNEYIENSVDEVAFCEGSSSPLQRNRTGELAMECWNLRKTIVEQTANNLQLKKDLKTSRNLIRSLQRTANECESECLEKTKDIHAQKLQILQCDKKFHELTTTSNILNSSFTRSKKLNVTLKCKLDESEKQNKHLLEKINITNETFKNDLSAQESVYSLEIRKLSEERDRYAREADIQQSYANESAARASELDASCHELKSKIDAIEFKHSDDLLRLAKEQDKSYDLLHARLEKICSERDALCRRLVEKELEHHQLLSFVLMEGLQLPEMQPPPPGLFQMVADKFPAGESNFIGTRALIDSIYDTAAERCSDNREDSLSNSDSYYY